MKLLYSFNKLGLNQQTGDQNLIEGQAFSFTLPNNTFVDAAINTIAYSASLVDGTALPTWISFDPVSLTFSGSAPAGIAGTGIRLQATDSTGAMSEEAFHLYPAKGLLSLNAQEDDVQLHQGPNSILSVSLPAGSFADSIVGRTVTLSATQTDGTPLPAWLTFDPTTATLNGNSPSWNFDQQVEILATASDGVVSAEAFHIRNSPLSIQQTLTVAPGTTFSAALNSIALPPSVGQVSVRSLDGSALPDGITVTGTGNGVADTLNGTMPTTAQKVSVLVDYTPVDTTQHSTTKVDLTLVPSGVGVPALGNQSDDTRLTLGSAFTIFPGDVFNYGSSGTDVITATGEGGAALPSWMKYDPVQGTITGTAPLSATSTGVVLTDTDKAGFTASEEFHVYVNQAVPTLQTQSDDVRVMLGNAFSTTISPGAFTDPDGGAVTTLVTGQGGTALPSWMSYDAVTGVLSGTAPTTQTTQSVVVTATGSKGGVSAESFNVYGQPDAPVSNVQQDDLRFRAGSAVSVVLDPNAFTTTASNPVTLTAKQQNGGSLPGWLSFNAATATFSGNAPTTPGTVAVDVIATDTYGRTTGEGFKFLSSTPAVATGSYTNSSFYEFGAFSLNLGNSFSDQVGSTAFKYTANFFGTIDPRLISLAMSPTGVVTGNITSNIPLTSSWNVNITGVGNNGSVGHESVIIRDSLGYL